MSRLFRYLLFFYFDFEFELCEYVEELELSCFLCFMVWFVFQAAIGGWHCLAVDDQGRAYAWGMSSLVHYVTLS